MSRLVNIISNLNVQPELKPVAFDFTDKPVDCFINTIAVNNELLLKSHPGKVLYSMKEAAEILGISYEFVRSKVIAGIIRVQSFGSRKLIHVTELSRLISEGIPS